MKVLANDGISKIGAAELESAGLKVITSKVPQDQLIDFINKNEISVILVRSATQVRKDIIDACPSVKIIGRGGVGMDNIDVSYAREKGIHVINTPSASSSSVAELVFGHLYGGVRFLFDSNRNMPLEGESRFKELKKNYSKGVELRGKTLGIIGLGRIGCEVAKIALGSGMRVIANDSYINDVDISLDFFDGKHVSFHIKSRPMEEVLKESDFVTLHVPSQKNYVIGRKEIAQMKDGAAIINASRGGIVDEEALIDALDNGKLSFAGLDTFENEPNPSIKIIMNPKISLSPHIGAATIEAQDRVGSELAGQIISLLIK